MTNLKIDLVKYISKPLIAGGLLFGYDMLRPGIKNNWTKNLYDAGLLSGSIVVSQVASDLFIQNSFDNGFMDLPRMLIQPLITLFLYSYLYNTVIRNENNNANKSQFENYTAAGIISVLTNYFENPIVSLFSGTKIY